MKLFVWQPWRSWVLTLGLASCSSHRGKPERAARDGRRSGGTPHA